MTPNEKRARLVMDLVKLGSGAGVIEKAEAARRVVAAFLPDEAPAVYDRLLNSEHYVLRETYDQQGEEMERIRALLIEAREKINDLQNEAAAFREESTARLAKIADLTSAVEHRDRRIAEITHEKNELTATVEAYRKGWEIDRDKIRSMVAIAEGVEG